MASISRICSQQQSTFSNESISVYRKLWERIENGGGYQKKRKGREGNKVCGKDEKGTRRDRSGIKEDSGRNEVAGR